MLKTISRKIQEVHEYCDWCKGSISPNGVFTSGILRSEDGQHTLHAQCATDIATKFMNGEEMVYVAPEPVICAWCNKNITESGNRCSECMNDAGGKKDDKLKGKTIYKQNAPLVERNL